MREDYYEQYFRLEDRHWWFRGRREILVGLLDRHVGPDPTATRPVLDVGCGTGAMLETLARYGCVEGVDSEQAAIDFCHQRGLSNVSRATVPPLPFPDGRFELVTAFDFLEHVDDDTAALREIRRVLKPDATCFMTVPAHGFLWSDHDRISHHRRRYGARGLRERLVAAGLEPRRITYFNSLLFAPVAAVRLGQRLLPRRDSPRSDLELPGQTSAVNRLLSRVFAAEAALLSRRDLPVGVSLLAIATAGRRREPPRAG
jgi:SAM-dependent methyltransferase